MSKWKDGNVGALRMGLGHGFYCVFCCWFLMAILLVAGVMNMYFVVALTVFVLLEKIGRAKVKADIDESKIAKAIQSLV